MMQAARVIGVFGRRMEVSEKIVDFGSELFHLLASLIVRVSVVRPNESGEVIFFVQREVVYTLVFHFDEFVDSFMYFLKLFTFTFFC